MKLKRYVNGAWVIVDKELKQLTTATDSAASPISIIAPLAEPFDNYRVYGTSEGVGEETPNLCPFIPPRYTYNEFYIVDTLTGAQSNGNCFLLPSAGSYSFYSNLKSDMYFIKAFTEEGELINDARFQGEYTDGQTMYFTSAGSYWRRDTNANTVRCTITVNQPTWIFICTSRNACTEFTAVPGPTAPDHYIPYGYKIPLITTSGAQSTTTPVYIGSSKLYEEEYLDYESGKVYKRTENLWDAQSTSLTFKQVASTGSKRWAFTITEPGIYTVKCFDGRRGYVYCRRYNVSTDNYGTLYRLSVPEEGSESPQTATLEVDSDIILLIYPRSDETADDVTTLFNLAKLCVVPGSTVPETFIPYLQPTDPPVPFEAIQHYAGESTISVDTTVAPDKLELTYQGWRVAANPKPKFYHNGQWMTEYRRVEYIKSDGNPYIVTDIVGLNAATDYIETEMSFGALGQLNDGTCLFGCATVDSGHWTAFAVLGDAYNAVVNVRNNCFLFYPNYSTGGSGTIKRMSCVTNGDYSSKLLLSLKTPQAAIVNTSTSTTYTPTILDPDRDATTLQPIDFTQLAKFCVFAGQYYRGEDDIRYYRCGRETSCYNLNIYRNNILTHNLIPVERQIDGVLGLYDTITDTFYTNSGTGTFVKGGYI